MTVTPPWCDLSPQGSSISAKGFRLIWEAKAAFSDPKLFFPKDILPMSWDIITTHKQKSAQQSWCPSEYLADLLSTPMTNTQQLASRG